MQIWEAKVAFAIWKMETHMHWLQNKDSGKTRGTNNMYIWEAKVAVMAAPPHPSSNAYFSHRQIGKVYIGGCPSPSCHFMAFWAFMAFWTILGIALGNDLLVPFMAFISGILVFMGLGWWISKPFFMKLVLHGVMHTWQCGSTQRRQTQIQLVHPLVLQQRRSSGPSGLVPSPSGMADLLVSFLDSILVAFMEFMATFMLVFMAFMVESLGAMAALGRRWMHLQVVAQASLGLWNGFHKKVKTHDHM